MSPAGPEVSSTSALLQRGGGRTTEHWAAFSSEAKSTPGNVGFAAWRLGSIQVFVRKCGNPVGDAGFHEPASSFRKLPGAF